MLSNGSGGQWINVCWYYRPEQTVHRSSRQFIENEVFKSGQYRDHPANQILAKTFVQFITRYTRGRPKHWDVNERIWVCESRYNDLTKTFSKINQWRACVPEEVRFDEYEMYNFDKQIQPDRYPSPLLHLLNSDEKIVAEGDKLPDPLKPGSEDAPPELGAIYRGDSPEPEKEPTPPPQPAPSSRALDGTPSLPAPMPYTRPPGLGMLARGGFPQARYLPSTVRPPPQPVEQPLAFTMPVSIPGEVAELVARDNQGRVLWFNVPPVDVVGWGDSGPVSGHTLDYLVNKRRKMQEREEPMQEVSVTTPEVQDKRYKKRATELLVKGLELISK
jgi:chromatin structure-remodeling complex subunit RSC1/2